MSDQTYDSDSTEALDMIGASPLFGRLDRATRAELADSLSFVSLVAGEMLFRQGDPGDSLYIVESGLLEVRARDAAGERVLDRLDAGAGVGELALLTGRPRTADVVAVVDSRLLRVAREGFERLVARHPAIASGFALAVAPRVQRLQLAGILTQLFGDLDVMALQTMQEQLTWRRLADGETLFHQGEVGTSMYIVVNGRLQVVLGAEEDERTERVLGEIGAGETVGEFALLTDEIRSATVHAIRDSDVVEMTRPVFESLIRAHPLAMTGIARIIVLRQKRALRPEIVARPVALSIALFAAGEGHVPLRDFAHQLQQALLAFGPTVVFTSEAFDEAYGKVGAAQTEPDDALSIVLNNWLQQQDSHYRHIIYVSDAGWTEWTRRCLAQADRILLLGVAGAEPRPGPLEAYCNPRTRKELVLLHPTGSRSPAGTSAWLAPRDVVAHHHVRTGDLTHWSRLARRLTGRTVGVVFSGGAARGLAHIGVVRALDEAGLEVDSIGATSMGALIGGLWAQGVVHAEGMKMAARMAKRSYLLDRTFPYTALMASHKVTAVLQDVFGDGQIEDLWRPFFCISTNLSRAEPVIHDRGPLWRAVRASIALPGVFSPVLNQKNELLVDGGVMNNFPVDILAGRDAFGLIVASNVSPARERPFPHPFGDSVSGWRVLLSRLNPLGRPLQAPTLGSTMLRVMEVNSIYQRKAAEQLADVVIEPDVDTFGLLDFEAFRELEQRGYEAGRAALQKLAS